MDFFEKFYNKALRFLSYRPRSEKEVRDKLTGKIGRKKVEEVDDKVIDLVIEKLKDKKFINDEEFAKWWMESRIRFKPRSLRLIKLELKQKGIDSETVNNLLASGRSGRLTIDSDLEQAKKLVEKRISRYKGLDTRKIYEKLGRYLASKGFDWNTVKKSIDEALKKGV